MRFKFKTGHLFRKEKLFPKIGYGVNISDIEKKLLQKLDFEKTVVKEAVFSNASNLLSIYYTKFILIFIAKCTATAVMRTLENVLSINLRGLQFS